VTPMGPTAGRSSDRDLEFDTAMSPAETVMWKIGNDPLLRPVAGTLAVVDRPIDMKRFRRRVENAVAEIARLRERVAPGSAPWDPPRWVADGDFDLDYHLRHVALAGGGSLPELQETVSCWYEDPLDPSRPLWQFVVVDGVEGGRGALFAKLHHTISDGIGLLRLSERYLDIERDPPLPEPVDLDRVVAEAAAGAPAAPPVSSVDGALLRLGRLAGWPLGVVQLAQRAGAEAALALLEPRRVLETTEQVVQTVRGVAGQLEGAGRAGGSPLWTARSGRRHLESLRVPLADIKRAGTRLGGSVNDVFVTGAVNGVITYHQRHGAPLDTLTFSFVVSQRQGGGVGGNFFTPVRVHLPVAAASTGERLAAVRDAMAARRMAMESGGALANLSGLSGLIQVLPASVLSQVTRSQVAGVAFATSNLRGAPFPLYIGGARVLHNATLGPLTGTPFNLTTLSYEGSLDMGLLVDPVAVPDPGHLRSCLQDAFTELVSGGK
jgi:diacylglycerol O-acyltransferase / wax synthase